MLRPFTFVISGRQMDLFTVCATESSSRCRCSSYSSVGILCFGEPLPTQWIKSYSLFATVPCIAERIEREIASKTNCCLPTVHQL